MNNAFAAVYLAETVLVVVVFRARRVKLFSIYGFAVASIFVVNYLGGALLAFPLVRQYFFLSTAYPLPFSLTAPEYFSFFLFAQSHLAGWLFAALVTPPMASRPTSAAAEDSGRSGSAPGVIPWAVLVAFVSYSAYLVSHLSLYQVLFGLSDYDMLRETAAARLGYFAYVFSKGLALFASLYLVLTFRSSLVRVVAVVSGLAAAFVTLQKSVPAYYVVAYAVLFLTRRRGHDLRSVTDRAIALAGAGGLTVAGVVSYLAYDAPVGQVALSIFRRVALLPHALDYDAVLMVDRQMHHQVADFLSSFPSLEQLLLHTQRYYMGGLLESFIFGSGAPNATANTYYITALYLDLRFASVAVTFLLALAFLQVDRWYYRRAHMAGAPVTAAYIAAVLNVGKLSSSHLGTVFVSEGIVFIVAAAAVLFFADGGRRRTAVRAGSVHDVL